MEQNKAKQIVLRNVRVKYAKLIRPGQAFDEGQPDLWSVNIYPTPEDMHTLMALGCVPKKDKNNEEFLTCKRNVTNKKGDKVTPPALVDRQKRPFAEEIGNGSVCNIAITPFAWTKGKTSGILLYINAVQVVDYIAMSNGVDAFDAIEEDPTKPMAAKPQAPAGQEIARGEDEDGLPF